MKLTPVKFGLEASIKFSADESLRPFRLYDPRMKRNARWRCYASEVAAHLGAIKELWLFGKIGDQLEVYSTLNAASHGVYTKRLNGLEFLGPKDVQRSLVKGA